jgi:hypothetical protein
MSRTAVTISTRRYRHIHGHRPHGLGLWYFQLPGGRVFAYPGAYDSARLAATDHARRCRPDRPTLIQVCA